MSLGMTYEEYWYGYPPAIKDYARAEEYRRKQVNYNAWLQGLYFASAISSTIGNAFLEKGTPPNEYPERPFASDEEEREAERKAQEEREAHEAKLFMRMIVEQGKHWGENPKKRVE